MDDIEHQCDIAVRQIIGEGVASDERDTVAVALVSYSFADDRFGGRSVKHCSLKFGSRPAELDTVEAMTPLTSSRQVAPGGRRMRSITSGGVSHAAARNPFCAVTHRLGTSSNQS